MIREQAIREAFAHFSNDLAQDSTVVCAITQRIQHTMLFSQLGRGITSRAIATVRRTIMVNLTSRGVDLLYDSRQPSRTRKYLEDIAHGI